MIASRFRWHFPLFSALVLPLMLSGAVTRNTSQRVKPMGSSASQGENQGENQIEKPVEKPDQVDPLKRPLSEKQRKANDKAMKTESSFDKKWLNEVVADIISDEERDAFRRLSNEAEREQFIEQFWLRRDPTPDTEENEFKDEHYRRIAYADEHFAAGKRGSKTDRGRMYIMHGAPDSIDAHPSGGTYERPMEEGGGTTSTYPFEVWRYRELKDVGQEIELEFVDSCGCGDYHMTIDRSEKDALLNVPGAGLTLMEQMNQANKAARFNGGLERLGRSPFNQDAQSKEFGRLEIYSKVNRPPAVKFKDMEAVVTSKVHYNLMPFDVRTDFVRLTGDTVLVPITLQMKNRDITFSGRDGVRRGTVNIFGRVTTLTGRVVQTFEETVLADVPSELLAQAMENSQIYWKAMPLRPNRYRLDIVVKDVTGNRIGTWAKALSVPDMGEEKGLISSSLILSDLMEKVPAKQVGAGNFVLGGTKVRPRLESADGSPASFKRGQKVSFWMQVYNLELDQQTKKNSATVEYDIVNTATNKSVVKTVETSDQMGSPNGDQLTVEKSLPLNSLEPGIYQITVRVNDRISKQTISPQARFTIE